ncbi:MAG: hypothetical protein ACK4NX_03085 [Candidatus Paceibacteria bacterium]
MVASGLLIELLKSIPAVENILAAGLLVLFLKEFWLERFSFFQRRIFSRLPSVLKIAKVILLVLIALLFTRSAIYSFAQYLVWKESDIGKFLLPPYQSIDNYINYAWHRFGKEPVFTFLFAGLVFVTFKIANFFTTDRFFYDQEPYFASISILISGWPASLIVVAGALLLATLFQLLKLFFKRPPGRFSLIYFWLPLGIFALNFGDIIGKYIGLGQFKI